MSAQKHRNKRLDLDNRENNKSVVQRFITEPAVPSAVQEKNQNNTDNTAAENTANNTPDTPPKEQAYVPANIKKEIVIPAPAANEVPAETAKIEYNTLAIAAKLEKLESRLEKLDNLEKLDKLDKLDGLASLEQKLDANLERKPEQIEPKYILFNAMEEAVQEEVRATLNNVNICKCDKCYYDICALVLNNMAPQYATTPEGVLMNKAKTLLSIDSLTRLSNEIFRAIEKVKSKPEHK